MDFSLRDFQDADFEHVWRIDQQCFAAGVSYSRRELGFYIRRRAAFTLVAEQDHGHAAEPSPILGFIVAQTRSEEHTSELQSPMYLVCRLLLEKKKPDV